MNNARAPIYEMLEHYIQTSNASFHVPGHKNGAAYGAGEEAGFLAEVMRADVTEISGTDDLHHPEGVIREAQELAADCFGAEESFLLVGGSTSGNLALILTVCAEPGAVLLLQRNIHKSVLHGLMLAGARAVFLEPVYDKSSGLPVIPRLTDIEQALNTYPEAAGLLLTLPNYYGMGSGLAEITEACHQRGVPLLVDEAHGAHYGLHPELPANALSYGADGVVQSTHKMLSALTMGAMLHVQGPIIDRAVLRQRLAMIQSSSPSYPVMASLDLARRLVHSRGPEAFTAGLAAVKQFRRGLAELPRYGLLQPPPAGRLPDGAAASSRATPEPPHSEAAYTTQDPFKAVIYDAAGVLSGFELQRRLEARGCVPEMSDDRHVVLLFSLGSTAEDAGRLLAALQDIDAGEPADRPDGPNGFDGPDGPVGYEGRGHSTRPEASSGLCVVQPTPPLHVSTWNIPAGSTVSEPVQFTLRPLRDNERESIPLEQAAGRMAAEMVIPYPPGIPVLYPGEPIRPAVRDRLAVLARGGAKFQGTADPALHTIIVYRNKKGGEA